MANIKHLQMWKDICTDVRISISKSLFGLRTTATFLPTNSIIDIYTAEFSATDGNRLSQILSSPREDLAQSIEGYRPQQIPNGNYLAEICATQDGEYLAVKLYQYSSLSYQPVTDTFIFEGDQARIVKQLF